MNKNLILAMLCLTLAACAPVSRVSQIDQGASEAEKNLQKELALQHMLKRQVRAFTVGYPILKNTAPYCDEKVTADIGAVITHSKKMGKDFEPAARVLWGVTEKPTIVAVIPGLPADKAGLKVGDQILSVNNKALTNDVINEPLKTIAIAQASEPVSLTVLRDDAEITATVVPDIVCDYPIEVLTEDAVNAYADGKKIFITSGMMRFAETDNELATVIGHELGHNQMGHMKKKQGNQLIGILMGALITAATGVDVTNTVGNIGAGAFSQEFEAEADYVGMYHSARAGYDVSDSPNFWRRMGAEHPKSISHGVTHPNTADRFLALDATAQEIMEKKESNQELIANLK